MPETAQALERMCNPTTEVSAHYLIDIDGQILKLISETKRAWHAGISSWRGYSNINDRSIGIELANPGHEFGYQAFSKPQIDSLTKIAQEIITRHPIPARNIIGHSDISPTRKKDPGEFFDWRKLALKGIGHWPEIPNIKTIKQVDESNYKLALEAYGYETSDLSATILAFQRHFLPSRCDGVPDREMFNILEILIDNI
jgi:N-acetylmuramoyl-L-alanine amidase